MNDPPAQISGGKEVLSESASFKWYRASLRLKSKVIEFQDGNGIVWKTSLFGLGTSYMHWTLEAVNSEQTKLILEEVQTGLFPLIFLNDRNSVLVFNSVWLTCLKRKVENELASRSKAEPI